MKQLLSTALALACVVLALSLVALKRSGDSQHETDTSSITDFSNQLTSAQIQIAVREGKLINLSNRLDECQATASTFSNQLTEAQSAVVRAAEQVTNLNRQASELAAENQTLQTKLDRRAAELTNQVAGLTQQLALTQTNLNQSSKDYVLLENRLRRDVAARLVAERKFNNLPELKAQIENLQWSPAQEVSTERIYVGLDIEVKSNSFHVIAPN